MESEELLMMPIAMDELAVALTMTAFCVCLFWTIVGPEAIASYGMYGIIIGMVGIGTAFVSGGFRFRSIEEVRPIVWTAAIGIVSILVIQNAIFMWQNIKVLNAETTKYTIMTVFVIGILEELCFRGGILNAQLTLCKPWESEETLTMLLYPNIILNGVIFGLFHWAVMMQMFGTLNLIYLFAIMCSGIILAFIATYTRRLSASMLAHALFNVIVVGTSTSMIPV